MVPHHFQVSLSQQIPNVWVFVRVINYTDRQLDLTEVTASYFQVDMGPPMEAIPGGEWRVPPRQSVEVACHRNLLDAEAKAFLNVPWKDDLSANLHVRVRGTAGKKRIALDPSGFHFPGRVEGLPSHPAAALFRLQAEVAKQQKFPARSDDRAAGATSVAIEIELSPLAESIFRDLAVAATALPAITFVDSSGRHPLRVDQALDDLRKRGLVRVINSYEEGTLYTVTPTGRDRAIQRGYV